MYKAFLLLAIGLAAFGQTPIEQGFSHMYNLDFNEAHHVFAAAKQKSPADPMPYVADAAAYLFAEFDRLHILQSEFFAQDSTFSRDKALSPDPQAKQAFLKELETGERLAHDLLAKNDRDTHAMFASVMSLGLHADYDGMIEKRYFSAVGYMKVGRQAAEKLLALDSSWVDAYVAMGVEAYVLGTKPMPLRFVLRLTGSKTDLEDGVRKVRLAAEGGHYLKPLARLLLGVAALRDHQVETAKDILRDLSKQFPRNKLYTEELARMDTLKK